MREANLKLHPSWTSIRSPDSQVRDLGDERPGPKERVTSVQELPRPAAWTGDDVADRNCPAGESIDYLHHFYFCFCAQRCIQWAAMRR
jgi:hypothetical protein